MFKNLPFSGVLVEHVILEIVGDGTSIITQMALDRLKPLMYHLKTRQDIKDLIQDTSSWISGLIVVRF